MDILEKLLDKIQLEYVSILFYRLQMMPPKGDSDRESYIADLNKFKDLTEKLKVDWISEKTTKTKQRIVEWKRKYNIVSADDKPVTLILKNSDISRAGDGAKKMNDISAPGGECIKIPMRGNAWAGQWFFGSALYSDIKYSVRIQVKADKKQKSGASFGCGLYSLATKKVPFKRIVDAAEISDTGFGWIELGTINGSDAPSAYFYIAQIADSAVSSIYVSRIEIIPEGEDGYNDAPIKETVPMAAAITKGVGGVITVPASSAKTQGGARRSGDAVSISASSKGWDVQWVLGNRMW